MAGDKAEEINPNRVYEGQNKRAFVCLSVYTTVCICVGETWTKTFTISIAITHKEAILPWAAGVILSGWSWSRNLAHIDVKGS